MHSVALCTNGAFHNCTQRGGRSVHILQKVKKTIRFKTSKLFILHLFLWGFESISLHSSELLGSALLFLPHQYSSDSRTVL